MDINHNNENTSTLKDLATIKANVSSIINDITEIKKDNRTFLTTLSENTKLIIEQGITIKTHEKTISEISNELKELKKYIYRSMGVVAAIVFLISNFGNLIAKHL